MSKSRTSSEAPGDPFRGAPARALLMVVSAPSGGGKTTLCDLLLATSSGIAYSVSCTTRKPRAGEEPGKSYHFLSEEEFERRVAGGEFLEHATVHGHRYGTLRRTVHGALARGLDIVMAIDVQGAAEVRRIAAAPRADPLVRRGFVDIFIAPPSEEELLARLKGRGLDSGETILRRMANAQGELARWREYRYVVVNDRVEEAVARLRAIREAEHCRNVG